MHLRQGHLGDKQDRWAWLAEKGDSGQDTALIRLALHSLRDLRVPCAGIKGMCHHAHQVWNILSSGIWVGPQGPETEYTPRG